MTPTQAQQTGPGAMARPSALPLHVVALQAGLALACAALMLLVATPGIAQATAALLAGACVCLPGLVVALVFTRPVDPKSETAPAQPALSVVALLAGFVAALVLMGVVFALFKPPALGFFSALIATQIAPVLAPALQDARRRNAVNV